MTNKANLGRTFTWHKVAAIVALAIVLGVVMWLAEPTRAVIDSRAAWRGFEAQDARENAMAANEARRRNADSGD